MSGIFSSDFQIGFEMFTCLKITTEGAIECICGGLNSRENEKKKKKKMFLRAFSFSICSQIDA